MITYDKQTIFKLKINCNEIEDQQIQTCLKQIDNIILNNKKKDNGDTNNNNANNWRFKKQNAIEKKKKKMSKDELSRGELNAVLNKITSKNFDTLSVKIITQIDTSIELAEYTVNNIFKKAVVQPVYCVSYVKLIKLLGEKGFDIGIITTNKCDQYTELLKHEDILGNKDNLNYDEFCELMSEKKYKVGYSQFIGELFNGTLIDYHTFIKNIFAFFESLESMLMKEDVDPCDASVENTIICICSLITTSSSGIKADDMNHFKTKLGEFNKMNKYQKRLRFKVLDLIEKM
jgi:hypothetical protein